MVSRVAVLAENKDLAHDAQKLAQQWHLDYASHANDLYDFFLLVTPQYIGLQTAKNKNQIFYIDFSGKKLLYRLKNASRRKELLAKAIGISPVENPLIVDTTAGWGRDSFILASLGYQVIMLEKSAIVYILLENALERAAINDNLAETTQRLQLYHTDSVEWLKAAASQQLSPDVIYLDPMFPPRQKSASAKKEMVILQNLLGTADNVQDLLLISLACAKKRVVVKRSRLAQPIIADKKPDFSLMGNSSRFDVYLV